MVEAVTGTTPLLIEQEPQPLAAINEPTGASSDEDRKDELTTPAAPKTLTQLHQFLPRHLLKPLPQRLGR